MCAESPVSGVRQHRDLSINPINAIQAMRTPPKSSQNQNAGEGRIEPSEAVVGDSPFPTFFLSIIASVFGIAGALILAMPAKPGLGFGAFVISNLAWIFVSAIKRQWPLHVQQWIFLICSLIGLWNWWLGPLMLG